MDLPFSCLVPELCCSPGGVFWSLLGVLCKVTAGLDPSLLWSPMVLVGVLDRIDSSEIFSWSSSSSVALVLRSLLLNRPLSIPGFLSLRFLSSLLLSPGDALSYDSKLPRTLESLSGCCVVMESSRKRLGVREIFFVSRVSSLKNESVLRTTPFLDRPGWKSSGSLLAYGSTNEEYRVKLTLVKVVIMFIQTIFVLRLMFLQSSRLFLLLFGP